MSSLRGDAKEHSAATHYAELMHVYLKALNGFSSKNAL